MNNVTTKHTDPYQLSSDAFFAWNKAKREKSASAEVLAQMHETYQLALKQDRIKNGWKQPVQTFNYSQKRWQTDSNGNRHYVS